MTTLSCDQIEATEKTQIRRTLDKATIDQYREDLESGAVFPPVDVFREKGSSRVILADGFHRLYAHIHADRPEIDVNIHEGGPVEAIIFAAGANAAHGLRRTNADKRRAVELCLKHPEISKRSRQEIADICRVTKRTVQKIANTKDIDDPDEGVNGSSPGEPQDPSGDDVRPTKPEPTQEDVEREELRGAIAAIKAFPYDGDKVTKLGLDPDDIEGLKYVSTWTASAVIALSHE